MDDQIQPPELPGDLPPGTGGEARPTRPSGEQPTLTPDMEAERPEAGAVPPGYDWPTHGGYLGCLLGMMPACLVGGFFGSTFVAWLNKAGVVPPVVAGLLVVALFVACVLGFGRIGWVLGRRFYRKYPRVEPTWGEDDGEPGQASGTDVADVADVTDVEERQNIEQDEATHQATHQATQ
ncbi:MAG TPA: hypothetical protein VJR48_11270 [Ktedonobacterales bacterium]|nr:hypothetical protein [Ktedonobacterales bacterium]